ncbi:MAG TPA: hypothetical protein VGX48_19215 [Pyrinomonadaceae bacterium]|jgi:predicted metalloprotease with PDZ domain|nr:hypothetical protein [Pyrinomonadaceae bacterium]
MTTIGRLSALITFLLCSVSTASARPAEVKLTISSDSPARVRVEGERREGATAWSFLNAYASAFGLAARVENLKLADAAGSPVPFRQVAPGEFTSDREATRFTYDVKLDPPAFVSDAAHVSWLANNRGLLMTADLLPLRLGGARLLLTFPPGWNVFTNEETAEPGSYVVPDVEDAVFAIGRDLRSKKARAGRLAFTLVTAGEWAFTDGEAVESAGEILKIYTEVTGAAPRDRATLFLLPPAVGAAGNTWSAETRGGTVTLISGRLPSKLAALSQLNGALSHELFHLWVPNGLALEGEYDWFYEGFTNYQAVRVGLRRGQLTFQDYLNAVGAAFDGYKAARGGGERSLPEASRRRWSGANAFIYHKGMLVAALYDLELMRQTSGESSLEDVYRQLFRRHAKGSNRQEGNRAIIEALASMPGMREFTVRYVEGALPVELAAAVSEYGLRIEPGGVRTRLAVVASPERGQRELLRKLGYNEKQEAEARKLHQRMKPRVP